MFQNFLPHEYDSYYCDNWNQWNPSLISNCKDIHKDTKTFPNLDCTDAGKDFDIQGLGCSLQSIEHYDSVIVNFPLESNHVKDFGKGESSKFFREFNGPNIANNTNLNKKRKSLKFYATKFDLADLVKNTDMSRTKDVMIKADTVVISEPIEINYKLKIRARIVSIDKAIKMKIPLQEFKDGHTRTSYKKKVVFSEETHLRHRQFGLVDILDLAPRNQIDESACSPLSVLPNQTDTSDSWFDPITVNLLYFCAATVQPELNSLAMEIANFNLDFHSNKEFVGDTRTFVAAQKFQRIQERGQNLRANNVPSYDLRTIKKLASVMYTKLFLYYEEEQNLDGLIMTTQNRLDDMEVQFQIVEMEQENYFKNEQIVLDAIFDSTNSIFDFVWDIFDASNSEIMDAIHTTGNISIDLQEQELKTMLVKAKNQVEHFNDLVNQYSAQIDRYSQKAEKELEVTKTLANQFNNDAIPDLTKAVKKFEDAANKPPKPQGFFQAILSIFTGGIPAIINAIIDIKQLIDDIAAIKEKMNEIVKMIGDFDFINFNSLTDDPSTDFVNALKQSIELKLQGPRFDDLKNEAENQVSSL